MKKHLFYLICILLLCAICFSGCNNIGKDTDTSKDSDAITDTELDTNTDTDTSVNTDTSTDTSTDTNIDVGNDSTSVLRFSLINNKTEYAVSGCDKTAVNVVIPSEYEGKPVTKIAGWSFSQNKVLESVVIPNTVRIIDASSFSNCDSLKHLEIPNSVEFIGMGAFHGGISLETVKIGSGVSEIEMDAFYYCTNLKEFIVAEENITYTAIDGCLCTKDGKTLVNYPPAKAEESYTLFDGVEVIGQDAFSYCKVKTVILKEGIKEIKGGAFSNSYITEIEIPKGITKIYGTTFENCMKLVSVKIPEGVTEIGSGAFINCYALKEIVVPEGVTKIWPSAFEFCRDLKKVILPSTVTEIEKYTFRLAPVEHVEAPCVALKAFWDEHLKHVKINGGEEVPYGILKEAPNLESVELCDTVKKIQGEAFKSCYKLKTINLENVTHIGVSAFEDCHELNNITLSKEIEKLDNSAFARCKALEKVIIPKNITTMGEYVFRGCISLVIYCECDELQSIYWEVGWNSTNCPVIWEYTEE